MEHTVKFERNTRTNDWRAICSCGWSRVGMCDEVQTLAATHDIEWVESDPVGGAGEPHTPPRDGSGVVVVTYTGGAGGGPGGAPSIVPDAFNVVAEPFRTPKDGGSQ